VCFGSGGLGSGHSQDTLENLILHASDFTSFLGPVPPKKLPQLGIHLGAGIVSSIIVATIGAIILLVILRLVNRGGRW
jgi:hypothetical protein